MPHAKHTTVYFISHLAKVVPCPVYPAKVRPLRGWLKENHPRFAAVFSFAKPCRNPRKTDWKDIKK